MGALQLTTFSNNLFRCLILTIGITFCLPTNSQTIQPPSTFNSNVADILPLTEQELIWLKQHPTLKVAVRYGWMPIEFQLESHKFTGVSIDYLAKLSQLTGITFELVNYQDDLKPTEVAVITGIRGNNVPLGFKHVETPYLEIANAIYIHTQNSAFQEDLNFYQLPHKTVAAFKSGPVAQQLKTLVPDINLRLVDIADEAFEALDAGLVDAYIGNELVLDYHIDFHKIKSVRKSGITPITSKVFFAASESQPELHSILNKAMIKIGTNAPEVLDTWRIKPINPYAIYFIPGISFCAILLLFQLIRLYQKSKKQAQEAKQAIWFQANHDFLTKLPNRYLLKNKLTQALQAPNLDAHKIGVMIIDLDNFKEINDTAGHAIGDEVLIEIAERIKVIVQAPNIISRFGGDEFLVLVQEQADTDQLKALSEQLIQAMATPFKLHRKRFNLSISIGAALFPDHTLLAEELIMFADEAMYHAKRTGKNKAVLFDQYMHELFNRRRELGNELRHAIEKDQLYLHYQPIYDLQHQHCEKVEALLRWHHPEFGNVPPDMFINLAEENGHIIELGEWVFEQVLNDYQALVQRLGNIEICINLSPIQLADATAMQKFISRLNETERLGMHFCFEITEGLLLEASNTVIENLNKIHAHGIKLAIDDFGTGYSSLAYLNKFKIDYVKIDRSFINNITNNQHNLALCKTIIFMGKQLNIQLIAEGVETLEQENLLKTLGCEFSQGFYRARPMPIGDL